MSISHPLGQWPASATDTHDFLATMLDNMVIFHPLDQWPASTTDTYNFPVSGTPVNRDIAA